LRDQALIYALLEEQDPAPAQRDERLFAVAEELRVTRWLSTQERNALFLAGRGVLGKPEPDWSAQLQVAGQSRALSAAQPGLKLDGEQLAEPLSLTGSDGVTLYQQLSLSGYPASEPATSSENLSIERDYYDTRGRALDLTDLHSGDLVLVHLSIRAKARVPDALVVDLLPAGLELENQNLAQSSASLDDAGGALKEWQQDMQNGTIRHQEFRDDRYVAALDVNSYGPTHLLYLARAVTPGTYRVPPPQVESMYRPSWRAQGATPSSLVVKER